MCKFNPKNAGRRIDPCMRTLIKSLQALGVRTISCCCGHGRYPMTIVCEIKGGFPVEIFSGQIIGRTKRFYQRDKKGMYFIPETTGGRQR